MKHRLLIPFTCAFAAAIMLISCEKPERSAIEVILLDSQQLVDSLTTTSDTVFTDTAEYKRRPKATLYVNDKAGIVTQVFLNKQGTVSSIIDYQNGEVLKVSEYYPNGQITCKYSYAKDGSWNGPFTCYYPDGRIKLSGEHQNGEELVEKRVKYDKDGYKIKE